MRIYISRPLVVASLIVAALGAAACREDGTVVVKRLSFTGVKAVPEKRLRDVLATKQSRRLPLMGKKRFFIRAQFDADLKRIKAFYADRGFPEARVTRVDVKLDETQESVSIDVDIDEGEPIRVASIDFEGFDAVPERRMNRVRRNAPLAVDAPLDRQLALATRESATNALKDNGYPYASVTINDDALEVLTKPDALPADRRVPLVFRAVPGTAAVFGPIEIAGNRSVSDEVIRRQLTFRPGDRYRRSVLQESQRKLYALELFEFANVEVVNPEQQSSDVPIKVTVAEGDHQRVNFGAGWGTEEKARADAEWHHVNFLGGARSAGVHTRWSSLDRGVRLDFNQPYFFGPRTSFGAEGERWFVDEPGFTADTYGGRAAITYRPSLVTTMAVTFTDELRQTTVSNAVLADETLRDQLIALGIDPRTGFQRGTLVSVALDLQRNTTRNLLNATRGYLASLHAEQAGGVLPGNFNYVNVSGEGRYYMTLARRFVVASRAQYGSINPSQNLESNVPFSKRFFLGGSTSLRGWGRYNVSPLSGSNLPIGGFSLFQVTSELRMPVFGNLGAVVFLDGGNVWADSWHRPGFNDLRYDVGPGLRYNTPIGPVRFDVGVQLNPIDGLRVNGKEDKRHFRIHFSIGQAF